MLLVGTAMLFDNGVLDAFWLTVCWMIVFFFASAGASARLPDRQRDLPDGDPRDGDRVLLRDRHRASAASSGPILFGHLIEDGIHAVAVGYYIGAGLMIAAGLVEVFLGVDAEGKSLEDIAAPLSASEGSSENAKS